MSTAVQDQLLLSLSSVSQRLDLSIRTVQELVATGTLPSLKIGRRRLVRLVELEQFIESHAERAA